MTKENRYTRCIHTRENYSVKLFIKKKLFVKKKVNLSVTRMDPKDKVPSEISQTQKDRGIISLMCGSESRVRRSREQDSDRQGRGRGAGGRDVLVTGWGVSVTQGDSLLEIEYTAWRLQVLMCTVHLIFLKRAYFKCYHKKNTNYVRWKINKLIRILNWHISPWNLLFPKAMKILSSNGICANVPRVN